MGLTEVDKMWLEQFRAALSREYQDRLRYLYVFGSRVRGDARDSSDLDVLVVLRDEKIAIADEKKITRLSVDLSFAIDREKKSAHNLWPVVLPIGSSSWDFGVEKQRPFYRNLLREGINLTPPATPQPLPQP